MKAETKTFTITASTSAMRRFERLMCLLQSNSHIGHSATVGMYLDGDGADRFTVKETLRQYRDGARKIAGVGYSVELATDRGYHGLMEDHSRSCRWRYADNGKDLYQEESE